jgi:translation initiation factor IF-2
MKMGCLPCSSLRGTEASDIFCSVLQRHGPLRQLVRFNTIADLPIMEVLEVDPALIPLFHLYDIVDDVRAALEGLLPVHRERELLGVAEVRGVFGGKRGKVAGCGILEGLLRRGARATVVRGGAAIGDGLVVELRRVNELVTEMEEGNECGIDLEDFHDWQIGDRVEAYELAERSMTLEDAAKDVAGFRSSQA